MQLEKDSQNVSFLVSLNVTYIVYMSLVETLAPTSFHTKSILQELAFWTETPCNSPGLLWVPVEASWYWGGSVR